MIIQYLDDPALYIGGTVVHNRTPKPTQTAYHSTDEESLRQILRPLADEGRTVLTAEVADRIRAKLTQQRQTTGTPQLGEEVSVLHFPEWVRCDDEPKDEQE